jgi:predicted small secreted protein
MKMNRRVLVVSLIGLASLAATACNPTDSSGSSEDLGSAHLAQLDPTGWHMWRLFDFTFGNSAHLADVLVIGEDDVGLYEAETEYWFVETANLQYLGDEALQVEYYDGDETPPSLSGEQEFTQPVHLTWNSFTSDPVSTGNLYSGEKSHLRIKTESGEITRLTWYQVLGSTETPENVTPDGVFEVNSGSMSVPTNKVGHYIDATIE